MIRMLFEYYSYIIRIFYYVIQILFVCYSNILRMLFDDYSNDNRIILEYCTLIKLFIK